jgi:uncharacterized membrane protein (DUF485 family)
MVLAADRKKLRSAWYGYRWLYWRELLRGWRAELPVLRYTATRNATPFHHWVGREQPPWLHSDDDFPDDQELVCKRRAYALTTFMFVAVPLWGLLTAAFSSVMSPDVAGATAAGAIVIITILIRAAMTCSRSIRISWPPREPAGEGWNSCREAQD